MTVAAATSADGTRLVYDIAGSGPVILLVDGAYCSRAFGPTIKLAPLLAPSFTVVRYDRRGRGDSSDTRPYAVTREIEDIETVIDAVGGSAALVGFSSGAILALRAAAALPAVTAVVAYEPPLVFQTSTGHRPPDDIVERLQAQVDAGRSGPAARTYLTRLIGVPAPFYLAMRLRPDWKHIAAAVPALPYDAAVFLAGNHDPAGLASIRQPVHVVNGSKSPKPLKDAAVFAAAQIPEAHHEVLDGQTHDVDVAALAPRIRALLAS